MQMLAVLNSPEAAAIAFVVGVVAGAVVEARYGSKITAVVKADAAKVESTVAAEVKKV